MDLSKAPVATVLGVADLNRARGFYEGKLGLTPREGVPGLAMYPCAGETVVVLYEHGDPRPESTAATWMVDDIAAAVRELRARGVVFEQYDLPGIKTGADGIADIEGMRGAWFKDPDGNVLSVAQM